MKRLPRIQWPLAISLLLGATAALGQDTSFTYQARLEDAGSPATGLYDLRFSLYGSPSGADAVGSPILKPGTGITNGLFTITLDFGLGVFSGPPRWLQIEVRTNGAGTFIPLSTRQALTPVPYAITASNLSGTLPAAQLSGAIPSGQLGGLYTEQVTFSNPANVFTGQGSGLTNLSGSAIDWGADSPWFTTGNADTTSGANFVGTTDNQPLEFKVNGERALRLEPTDGAPNIIGGGTNNFVWDIVGAEGVSIGGGMSNTAASDFVSIAGGRENSVYDMSEYATIGGGATNRVLEYSAFGTVGGGRNNAVYDWAGTIGGGDANFIDYGWAATIAGGEANRVGTYGLEGDVGAIGGGSSNYISSGRANTISGGSENRIEAADYAIVPGGLQAKATQHGQLAHASGQFAAPGDAQTSIYVCRNVTTDATQTELYLDGVAARLNVPTNTTWSFEALIAGRSATGASAGYFFRGAIKNNGGTATLLGPLPRIDLGEDVAAWDASIIAGSGALLLRVTGAAGTTIRWAATIRTIEVGY